MEIRLPLASRYGGSRLFLFFAAASLLVACFTLAMDVRQTVGKGVGNPNDFATLYAGAICASHECDPYRVSDLDAVLRKHRGDKVLQDWTDQLPIYPPTTLLVLAPFSSLPYPAATLSSYVLSFSIYVSGLLWAFLFSPYLRGKNLALRIAAALLALHFPKIMQCLSFGNPSVLITGLLLFAVFDDVHKRYIPRVLCAGLAVYLKFTVALPLMLLVLFSDRTRVRRGWKTLAGFAVITLGILCFAFRPAGMHRWPSTLRQNVALGERNGMSASAHISPSNVLLNVANLPGYFTQNSVIIGGVTYLLVTVLGVILLIAIIRAYRQRGWDQTGYAIAVPAVAVMTLLPVYHRFCDIGLVLFVVPWLIQQASQRTHRVAWAVAAIVGLLYFSWERRIHLENFSGWLLSCLQFLYFRGDAVLILLLAAILVSILYRATREKDAYPASAIGEAQ
jgi:hypothetical protein